MSDENGKDSILDLTLAKYGISQEEDQQIIDNQNIRTAMVHGLIDGHLDPKVAAAASKLISDHDKSILTRRRMVQDERGNENRDNLLREMYKAMVVNKENSVLSIGLPEATSEQRRLDIDSTEFNFSDDELIIGNDTEASFE